MVWSVKGGPADNEVVIEADLQNWKTTFMSATAITRHRGNAKRYAGKAGMEALVRYTATLNVGEAMNQHKPGALAWVEERGPWHAEPFYDDTKRGAVIVGGKARLILKDRATALLFKLTWG